MKTQSASSAKAAATPAVIKTETVEIAVDPITLKSLADRKISVENVAAKYGVSRRKIVREIALMIRSGMAPASLLSFATIKSHHDRLDGAVVLPSKPRAARDATPEEASRAHIVELQKRLAAEQRRASTLEDRLNEGSAMSRVLDALDEYTPRPDPTWLSDNDWIPGVGLDTSVPILVLTDWHLGEKVFPGTAAGYSFDVNIAKDRVRRTIENATSLLRRSLAGLTYPGIILALGGDMVSGSLHPELAETDELEVLPSSLVALDVLTSAIDAMVREFGRVFIPTCVGNHGRVFDRKPRAKGYADRNIDQHIYSLLDWHYRDHPNVIIRLPDAGETMFETMGLRFLLTHGDSLGATGGDGIIGSIGPVMRGSLKTFRSLESVGTQVDHMIIGHYHQQIHLPKVTVCGSLKGPDEYSVRKLRAPAEDPTQTLIVVHPEHGITFRQAVFLRDDHCPPRNRSAAGEGWVNVFEKRAA